jgi:hypothetical protein
VPSLAEVSDFNDMRNRMLNVLLEEEKRRRTASFESKQYASTVPADFNPYFSILTPGFYEAYYNADGKTNWGMLKGEVTDEWNSVRDTPAYKKIDENLESMKRRFLAERFAELACDGENAPFVARGLILNDAIARVSALAEVFLAKVRDNPSCRGAAELKPKDFGAIELMLAITKNGANTSFIDKTEIRYPEK